jgi:hypothetical protein
MSTLPEQSAESNCREVIEGPVAMLTFSLGAPRQFPDFGLCLSYGRGNSL